VRAGAGPEAAWPPFTVALLTFGCRAAQADEEMLRRALELAGVRPVDGRRPEGADAVVVHGCVVTQKAERDARKAVRRLRREHPALLVVAAGCYVRHVGEEPVEALGADLLLPDYGAAESARRVVEALEGRRGRRRAPEPAGPGTDPRGAGWPARRRLPIRIQDGCDEACAYCIVPSVRGPSRSLPVSRVLDDVRRAAGAGVPEVVLTGINAGAWGRDLDPPVHLIDLVEEVLRLPDRPRVRLSSIEPQHIDDPLLALLAAGEGICPHVHVPLQSVSARLLEAMGRPPVDSVLERLERFHAEADRAAIGFDLISGLPGETPREAQETADRVERFPAAYLHVFTYSPRPGVRAGAIHPRVPEREAVLRTRALLRADARARLRFRESLRGGTSEVVVESVGEDGAPRGTTERFVPAVVVGDFDAGAPLIRGTADGLSADGLLRVVVGRESAE
jgi:threonylcarbamoyladenosine tRNA methylthiotransferase MtaB